MRSPGPDLATEKEARTGVTALREKEEMGGVEEDTLGEHVEADRWPASNMPEGRAEKAVCVRALA